MTSRLRKFSPIFTWDEINLKGKGLRDQEDFTFAWCGSEQCYIELLLHSKTEVVWKPWKYTKIINTNTN